MEVVYTVSNGRAGDELERIWKDEVVALSWYCPGFARRDWKIHEKLSHDIFLVRPRFEPAPPEYKC
jgi:hypothetical protein